jgi:hypothetical protein
MKNKKSNYQSFINDVYLKKNLQKEMSSFFEENGFLQLTSFLSISSNSYIKILDKIHKEKKYSPLFHSYSTFLKKTILPFEITYLMEFLRSQECIDFLETITEFPLQFSSLEYQEFQQGDYTLLHDLKKNEEVVQVIYDLSDSCFTKEMGGILTYTTRDEEVFYLDPLQNALTVLFKSSEIMYYTKYVNCKSKGKKIRRFIVTFDISDDVM